MSEKIPFGTKIFNTIESVMGAFAQMGYAKGDAFIDVHGVSVEDDSVLLRNTGNLFSVIEIRGILSAVSGSSYVEFLDKIEEIFTPFLNGTGHNVQFVFKRDHQGFEQHVDQVFKPVRKTLNTLGLEWDWLLESRKKALKRFCAVERVWLVLDTNMGWATAGIAKSINAETVKMNKNALFLKDAQATLHVSKMLLDRHVSALNSIYQQLTDIGTLCEVKPADQVLHDLRYEIDAQATGNSWRPRTVKNNADNKSVRLPSHPVVEKHFSRMGGVLPPSIRKQLMPRAPQFVENDAYIRIGSRLYAPMVVTLPPITPKSFTSLVNVLTSQANDVPLRLSFRLNTGVLNRMIFHKIISGFKWTQTNREMSEVLSSLNYLESHNTPIVGLSISLTTWIDDLDEAVISGEIDNEAGLSRRVQMLMQIIQGWGQTEVSDIVGAPVQGVCATVPGLSLSDPAPIAACPLEDITMMLPMTRPGSPWANGSFLFRTPDGKVMPYQPGSSLQSSWSSICYAPPGSGKSVLLSTLMVSQIMAPGRTNLPFIGILDIGPSSRGLIDLIRSSLPESERHIAMYVKMQNTKDYAINPFDLPLGFDRPTPPQKIFLQSFLSTIVSETPSESPDRSVMDLLVTAIETVYEDLSREKNPRIYDKTEDAELNEFLLNQGFYLEHGTSWWDVVDYLFEKGFVTFAKRAQRYAMPTLTDLSVVINSDPNIRQRFTANIKGQKITDYVYSAMRGAIQRYPILVSHTRFVLDAMRIVALNLEEICPKGSQEAARQTSIMYMLARHAIVSRFMVDADIAESSPPLYKKYHVDYVREAGPEVKIIAMDEFHRTEGAEGIKELVEQDIRLGRKFNVQVILFSQNPNDFSDIMVEYSTTQFILSDGQQSEDSDTLQALKKRMGLNKTDIHLISRLQGPSKRGSMAYVIARLKSSQPAKMFVYNTIGPVEMWAFETHATNRAIREEVVEFLGLKDGLQALAERFPTGSAVEEVERYMSTLGMEDDESGSAVKYFVKQILDSVSKKG